MFRRSRGFVWARLSVPLSRRRSIVAFLAGLAACLPISGQQARAKTGVAGLDVAVLYAGVADSPRARTWVDFLRKHVRIAESIELANLSTETAASYDVVVVDAPSPFRGDRQFSMPEAPRLTRDFGRPTILVGSAGGALLRTVKIKLDWLCLSLRGEAHGVDIGHEIFSKPFPVDLSFRTIDTPAHYRKYVDGADLGARMRVWRVHEELDQSNVGLVADGYRFEDSPDAEYISGGLNSKNPGAVALGRQGNWFLWGFSATPDEMTSDARRVFLNSVAYMRQFDGERALHPRKSRGREWALNYARLYRADEGRGRLLESRFAPIALAAYEEDRDGFARFLRKNLDYIYSVEREVAVDRGGQSVRRIMEQFEIDADAKALGIANHSMALLERCVRDLERGEEVDRAVRVLERYTGKGYGNKSGDWRLWLDTHRDGLYFSDAFGYRFFVDATRQGVTCPASEATEAAVHTSLGFAREDVRRPEGARELVRTDASRR